MKQCLILFLLCGCLWSSVPAAAQNPFVSGKQEQEEPAKKGFTYPRFLQPMLSTISAWQRTLKRKLTRVGREIREHPYGSSFWLFLFFSFVYGSVHALGPGHGKTIVVSYFLSRPGKYLHGLLMGNLLTFVHVFSAVSIILVVRLVLKTTGLTSFDAASRNLGRISYALLIILGLVLLGRAVYELRHGHTHGHGEAQDGSLKHGLLTAFVTGLIPCPSAALILMFTLRQQIVLSGILAMFCVALGMGLTTTLFAFFAITSRNILLQLTARHQKLFTTSYLILSITGAFVIIIVGIVFLMGQNYS